MSYIDRETGTQYFGLEGTYVTKRFIDKEGREECRLKYEYPREDGSYIFTRDWCFESSELDYAYEFYLLLGHMHLPYYEPFDMSEPSESYDLNEGGFVYDIFFSCSLPIRIKIEYRFRRIINQPFLYSEILLRGYPTRGYRIDELR